MVIRLGRNGRFLACSLYPEHQETRPLPGEEPPPLPGQGEPCPECGQGVLTAKRGRFGPFLGCSRYPDCRYIKKDGPPPPDPLPFEVACPRCGEGHLAGRRARRTGNVFWGCSRYPDCDFTTNFQPVGALHDADAGPVARRASDAICLRCGATMELPEGPEADLVGRPLAGGPPDPGALVARRGRGNGAGARRGGSSGGTARGTRRRARTPAA
ncbi:MAG: topoisomerase DNA-binding C4 zinc finger domain-containing protein [Candidatus Limnocylindrales bacterium]